MSDATGPKRDREQFWKDVVVPAVRGLECFFWDLALLLAIASLLLSFNHFTQGCRHEGRATPAVGDQAVPQQSAGQR